MRKSSKHLLERRKGRRRERKILNLEERVQAIHMYDENPVYTRVANELKCSWEQIKNVIQNRDSILEYYARCQTVDANDNGRMQRQKKINFLGQVMYEYAKRAYRHSPTMLDDRTLKERALRFRSILQIPNFYPNKAWLTDFRHAYDLNFTGQNLSVPHEPLPTMDYRNIIAYCRSEAKFGEPDVEPAGRAIAVNAIWPTNKDAQCDDSSVDDEDYLELGDGDEEINENEEGPTIFYGDDEMMEEDSVASIRTPIEARSDCSSPSLLLPMAQNTAAEEEKRKIPPLRITIAKTSSPHPRIKVSTDTETVTEEKPLPALCMYSTKADLLPNNGIATTTLVPKTEDSTKSSDLRIDDYAAALDFLRPLQDFAVFEEDFRAINLLSQLVDVYRNGVRRTELRTRTNL